MEITNAHIKMLKKGGFYSVCNENLKHIKILPYLSIVQSIEGSYDIALDNGAVHQTGDGGFFIAPANVQQTIVHHVNKESGKMSCRWIFVDIEINKAFPLDSLYQFPLIIDGERKPEINKWFLTPLDFHIHTLTKSFNFFQHNYLINSSTFIHFHHQYNKLFHHHK